MKSVFFTNKIALIILLLMTYNLNAQDRNSISLNFINGNKILNQSGTYMGIGASYNLSTIGNYSAWIKMLNVENIVIDASFNDMNNITGGNSIVSHDFMLSNTGYFGYHLTLGGALDINLIEFKGLKLFFSPGMGVLYSTKDYFNTGSINQVMGGSLNLIVDGKFKLAIPVNHNSAIQVGADVSHVSNSGTAAPNVGLNRIQSFIGLTKYLGDAAKNIPKFSVNKNSISVEMITGYTAQQTTGFYQLNGVNLQLDNSYREKAAPIAKGALSIAYNHYLNDLLGLNFGTDVIYSQKTSSLGSTTSDTTNFIKTFQGDYTAVNSHFNVGISGGLNVYLGRLVFSGSCGYYLGGYEHYVYQPGADRFEYGREFYTKFDAKYFITPLIALQVKSFPRNFAGVGVSLAL